MAMGTNHDHPLGKTSISDGDPVVCATIRHSLADSGVSTLVVRHVDTDTINTTNKRCLQVASISLEVCNIIKIVSLCCASQYKIVCKNYYTSKTTNRICLC